MKKKFIGAMLALSMLAICVPAVEAKAEIMSEDQTKKEATADKWIGEMLDNYEPYLELKEEYPDASKVYSKTEYVLSEIISDQSGKIVKTNTTKYSSVEEMRKEHMKMETKNVTSSYGARTVRPGEISYSTAYSEIQLGVALIQYADDSYMVAFLYDWLERPPFNIATRYNAAVALALGGGMTMEGTSYEGMVMVKKSR